MSRIRSIKPEFWTSEQVVECSPNARLLFIGVWSFADDNGVLPARAKTLKMLVFPGDDFTAAQVQGFVDELLHQGLLAEFTGDDGCRYWYVTGWRKHQKIDRPNYKHPPPPLERCSSQTAQQPFVDCSPTAQQPFDEHSTSTRRALDEQSPPEWSGVEGNGEEEPQEERGNSHGCADVAAPALAHEGIAGADPEPEPEPKASRAPAKATKVSKGLIPADWQPAESTYGILDDLGIDRRFAASCVPEFVLYWTERGERRPGWEASFVNSVKRTWERRPPPSVPGSDGLTPVGVGSDRLKGRTVVEEIMARHRRFEEIHGPYVPEDGFDPFAASLRPAQPVLPRPEPRLLEGEYAH